MSVIQKAQELGYALLECEETTILRAAEINLDQDPEAQALIRDFQKQQQKIQKLQEAGIEVSEDDWQKFGEVQEKMKENKALQAYFSAQKNFQKILQQVNAIINQILSGGSCSPSACSECQSPDCM
ncbi:MAG: YlbF family regulator [Firmicutes bacterium]|nr:YlbF family regulator [Bacillota bacterium]